MLSLEAFAAVNLLLNLLVLLGGLYGVRHIRWGKVLTAALLGMVYAAAAFAQGRESVLGSLPVRAGVLLGMAGLAQGRGRRRTWTVAVRSAMCAAFAAGVMQMAGVRGGVPGVGAIVMAWAAVTMAVFWAGTEADRGMKRFVRLRICAAGGMLEVNALIDTGNRLREPFSGLPVLIIGRASVLDLLGRVRQDGNRVDVFCGSRSVHYGVLGGEGEMQCIRPESVYKWAGHGWQRTPDVWIGLFDGEIPSGVEAIAPPSLGRRESEYAGH